MNWKKSLILFACFNMTLSTFAETETDRARRLVREEIDYDKIQRDEESRARKLIRDELNYGAIKQDVEAAARLEVRKELDFRTLKQQEEKRIRNQIASEVDRQKIFNEEWAIESEKVHGQVRLQFRLPEVYRPIQEQAQELEIARITKEEENRVRRDIGDQIRRAFRERCNRGEFELVTVHQKRALEVEVLNQVRAEEREKYRKQCYANAREALTQTEMQRIHDQAFHQVLGDALAQKTRYLNEQKAKYIQKVEGWNWRIRLLNAFLLPNWRLAEYAVAAEADRMLLEYEKQMH